MKGIGMDAKKILVKTEGILNCGSEVLMRKHRILLINYERLKIVREIDRRENERERHKVERGGVASEGE
jgi:hypothetical protein